MLGTGRIRTGVFSFHVLGLSAPCDSLRIAPPMDLQAHSPPSQVDHRTDLTNMKLTRCHPLRNAQLKIAMTYCKRMYVVCKPMCVARNSTRLAKCSRDRRDPEDSRIEGVPRNLLALSGAHCADAPECGRSSSTIMLARPAMNSARMSSPTEKRFEVT